MSSQASQLDFLLAGVRDTTGNPLIGGKVYCYQAGTTTLQAIYTDKDKVTPATNPIVLDASGQAQAYADGFVKLLVKDANDVLLYTWDYLYFGDDSTSASLIDSDGSSNTLLKTGSSKSIKLQQNSVDKWEMEGVNANFIPSTDSARDVGSASYRVRAVYAGSISTNNQGAATVRTGIPSLGQVQDSTVLWGGTATGAANAFEIALSPAITYLWPGTAVRFTTTTDNTGASTLKVNALGAINIYNPVTNKVLVGGEILANTVQECVYSGSVWWLMNPACAWRSYTPTVAGFSVNPNALGRYKYDGKTCTYNLYCTNTGTSNATTFTVTAPFAPSYTHHASIVYTDNGVTGGPGSALIVSGSNIVTLGKTGAGGGFNAGGGKNAAFTLTYEVA